MNQGVASISNFLVKANNEFENAWLTVFEISKAIGSSADFEHAAHRVLSYNPQNSLVHQYKSDLSNSINYICKLIEENMVEINKNSDKVNNWATLSKLYLLLSDYSNAYASISHVLRINSNINDPFFWYTSAIVYMYFNYYTEAFTFFMNAKNQNSNFESDSSFLFRFAILLRLLGKYKDSIEIFTSLIKSLPDGLTADDIKFQISYTFQLDGNDKEAISQYQELASRHPNSLELIQQFSWFLSLQNDRNSLSLAERLVVTAPVEHQNDPILKFVLARIALKSEDTNAAYNRYKENLSTWSDSPLFWCGLGLLYLKNEQFPDAIIAFQRAIFIKQDILEAWLNFGLIYQKQGDIDSSIKVYQTALSNCNNAQIIQERVNALNSYRSGTTKQVPSFEILEIDSAKLFIQVAEKISSMIASTVPLLKSTNLGYSDDKNINNCLKTIYSPFKTLFQPKY